MKFEETQTLLPVRKPVNGGCHSRDRKRAGYNYKLWVLAAVLLLAFGSMLTGSVSLKGIGLFHSVDGVNGFSAGDDLDVLEIEEREKVVRQMWDVYGRSGGVRVPRFWREAFEAAYEFLISDSAAVRSGAVSDIAKLSLVRFVKSESTPARPNLR
ncbi:PREDICTED: uncharacterized protein LOC104740635 [Camelina sativa]|uniref:Uncharacterized protein LOC104740635 n=1 Tax=Camelina sativa TaxID=90675 RepID=A0ABM0VQC6_CAMSA|nr:PREDICTED: uncharacterized protein LOC104740635 [Camelina sativa]